MRFSTPLLNVCEPTNLIGMVVSSGGKKPSHTASDHDRVHEQVGMVVACTVAPLFEALAGFHRAHP